VIPFQSNKSGHTVQVPNVVFTITGCSCVHAQLATEGRKTFDPLIVMDSPCVCRYPSNIRLITLDEQQCWQRLWSTKDKCTNSKSWTHWVWGLSVAGYVLASEYSCLLSFIPGDGDEVSIKPLKPTIVPPHQDPPWAQPQTNPEGSRCPSLSALTSSMSVLVCLCTPFSLLIMYVCTLSIISSFSTLQPTTTWVLLTS